MIHARDSAMRLAHYRRVPFDPSDMGSPRLGLGGDVEVINLPLDDKHSATFARRGLESRGKQRTSIEIQSEPLLFDLDDIRLGAKPSQAIRDILERETKNITADAAPETLERRKRAAASLAGASGTVAREYRRRYSGGRTGFKPPNQTIRLFNDSGRLAEGWFVRENKEDVGWTVNVTANRLTPEEFRPGRFDSMLTRLRDLVPSLKDIRAIAADGAFNRAVTESIGDAIAKGEMTKSAQLDAKLAQLKAARRRAAMAVLNIGRASLGL